MAPQVFLREEQIRNLFPSISRTYKGFGYAMDDFSVIHAFTTEPKVLPSGKIVKVWFVIVESTEHLDSFELQNPSENDLVIVFCLDNDNLVSRGLIYRDSRTDICNVKFVPERSELYSRSKGLLETSILEQKKVGVVGLGSGGSAIAIELAKAGIGNFVLMDFDRIELSNVARHICGINDLGRYKTYAVRDLILQKNPYAKIKTLEIDVNEFALDCDSALSDVDVIVCASDNDKSRFLLNDISLKYKIPAIFGRAITRAIGGDILRVRPHVGPCYNCLYSQDLRNTEEEISQKERQAKKFLPDYTSEESFNAIVQVGLSSDISPITNMMVKLSLVELSRGTNSGISSLEDDLTADFYIWANRREDIYESWNKLEYNFNKPSILRWYGARVEKDNNCMVCS
ncbi:MAG: ThiF family adenylyltransferase [Chitinophagaceae bacterium]|nr:MAG: ThiF family adenylyltransferase [Chitinophagaceae bacterium]